MSKHPIRFGFQSGQQNVTWDRMREVWCKLDAWGYDSLWAFDHFYPIFTPDPAGPCMENWTLLSALSQNTKRARIGALVNSNTYRNPCLTAKMAATLDQVSGGRLNTPGFESALDAWQLEQNTGFVATVASSPDVL